MKYVLRCCLLMKIDKCVGRKPFWSFLSLSFAYFGALLHLTMERLRHRCRSLFSSRGCVGCFTKPQLVIAVDEPSNGLKIQGREVKKANVAAKDLLSSSAYEMDNSTVQSQKSISSMSASNQNLDPHSTGSTSDPPEFVNHGLLLWKQIRQQWVGDRTRDPSKTREPRLSRNATYESLLGTNKPFPQPIPLPEMVDFLVDVWEQEGLYD